MIRIDVMRPVLDRAGQGSLVGRRGAVAVGVFTCALLTALGAQVRIPLPWTPVPLTLQTFFVPLAGAALGPGLGAASQALYLALGLLGVPVFAGGAAGPATLLGPTAGYLVGFPLAAFGTGVCLRRAARPGLFRIWLAIVAGTLAIYVCGVGWLVLGFHLPVTQALAGGVLPFLVGDGVKALAATGLVQGSRLRDRQGV
jgi:biotin transport system substrate-specific component